MPLNLQKILSLAKICSIIFFWYNTMEKNALEGSFQHFCPHRRESGDSGHVTSRNHTENSPRLHIVSSIRPRLCCCTFPQNRKHFDTPCDVTKGRVLLLCFPLSGRGFRTEVSDNHAPQREGKRKRVMKRGKSCF